ncbi:MAG: methyltransferase domain-containing protein [Sphingobacteriales bacterium]|nr:MAG: methyltransferase domain-containing protein [Sphingobacteriales bacterium]
MAWNPNTYNQFKNERAAPFHDLLALVKPVANMKVIDLGCGTGETTKIIADTLFSAFVTGIDSSAEMLAGSAKFATDRLTFKVHGIEKQLDSNEKFDLIFSNAAIQWVDDHEVLFPKIINSINKGGQLAIQMPAQHHNRTNILLNELADEAAFNKALQNFKRASPVLDTDRYASILFENGATSITVFEKIYPLILKDTEALYHWVSGTALIPYLEKLDEVGKANFIAAYKEKLKKNFANSPVFYPFKRILMHANFK